MNQLTPASKPALSVPATSVFEHASTGALDPHAAEQALLQPELLRSLKMHRKLALGIALSGIVLALLYFHRLWPIYQAQSLVYIQPVNVGLADANGQQHWPYDNESYETFVQQQITNVTRRDVMLAALRKLDGNSWQRPGESDQDAADRLAHSVDIVRNGSYQFFIGVSAHDAELAAQLSNAVARSYIESNARDQKSGNEQRLAALQEERDRIQSELAANKAEQDELNRQLGVASVNINAQTPIDEDIGRTHAVLVQARTARDEAQARLATLNHSPAALDAEADEIVATDPGLGSLKTSLFQRKATLLSQMANLTPNHPLYKQDQVELDKINTSIEQMARELRSRAAGRIEQKLRADLQRTAAVEDQVNGQLRQLVGTANNASSRLQRSLDLSNDIARLHERYGKIDSQMHDLQLQAGTPGAAVLIAAAVPPTHPRRSGVIRNTFFLMLASVLFAVATAMVLHKLDPRIYTASDIRQILGVTPVAQLPDRTQVSEAVFDEHLLRLAGAIEQARQQTGLQSLVLTGTDLGVGVSTLAQRLRTMLHASPLPASTADVADGKDPGQFRIADSAPLLASADSEYMARFSDCTLVVLQSGITTRPQLRSTAEALKRLNVSAVGFVLNQVQLRYADDEFKSMVRDSERLIEQKRQQRRSQEKDEAAGPAIPLREELAVAPEPARNEPLPPPARPSSFAATPATTPQAAEPASERLPWWLSDQPVAARASAIPKPLWQPYAAPEAAQQPARAAQAEALPEMARERGKSRPPQAMREVVTTPEILPPKEFIPVSDQQAAADKIGDARHDRRDAYDEVNILPSWRGQYRKKT